MQITELSVLFLWSFLAATILPIGSEPALAAIVVRGKQLGIPICIATAGNYLGACTTYWLALKLAERLTGERAERATGYVQKYGAPALLLSWLPFVGDAIVAAAGAARMPFGRFSLFTVMGKALRYVVVAVTVHGMT